MRVFLWILSQKTVRQHISLPIRVHAFTWYLWNHVANAFFQVYPKGDSATLEKTKKSLYRDFCEPKGGKAYNVHTKVLRAQLSVQEGLV